MSNLNGTTVFDPGLTHGHAQWKAAEACKATMDDEHRVTPHESRRSNRGAAIVIIGVLAAIVALLWFGARAIGDTATWNWRAVAPIRFAITDGRMIVYGFLTEKSAQAECDRRNRNDAGQRWRIMAKRTIAGGARG